MRTLRRLLKDESGMTMGLAVIMILLLSVMGAGLLTFVSRDLNVVIEENRGQRAFEVADAGIAAAKRQLASGVDTTKYNDPVLDPLAPVNDIQWSAAAGGLTLNDLDEIDTTTDSVNVKIKYRSDTEDFLVVSEGDYGTAKRKIEAIFEPKPPAIDQTQNNRGQPLYYTPSSIMIDGPNVGIKGISMFTRKDVLIEDGRTDAATTSTPYSYACFKADYANDATGCPTMPTSNSDPGTLARMQGVGDELCDWDTAPPLAGGNCFKVQGQPVGQGNYNTNGRRNASLQKVQDVGFGAEGKICSVPPGSALTIGTCPVNTSIASAEDGYVYDSTTTPQFIAKELYDPPTCCDPGANGPENPPDTITYPFPRLEPKAEYFRRLVEDPTKGTYWEGQPEGDPNSDWGLSTANASKVAFVDAGGGTVRFDPPGQGGTTGAGGSSYKGMIVVWCGDLQQLDNFRGIIFNLYGEGLSSSDGDPNTDCQNDDGSPQQVQLGPPAVDVGVYTNNSTSCTCWVYAEGGTNTRAGIILLENSSADFLPAGVWNSSLPTDAFVTPPATEFVIKNWRELYE
jgi:hypothetical protein